MTHPTNTLLTRAEIRDVLLASGFRPKEGDDLRPYVYAAADALVCAVINKLGASDAPPVATLRRGGVKTDLYDTAALAQARQQGYEAARAEFADDALRYRWLRGHANGGDCAWLGFGKKPPHVIDFEVDAARQPTQEAPSDGQKRKSEE